MKKYEYIGNGNETGFTASVLIGKRIVVAQKDGVGRSIQILSGTATPKEFLYNINSGNIDFGERFSPGEPALILYEDLGVTGPGCIPVSLSSVTLPSAFVGRAYNASLFANGTQPVSLPSETVPGWINVSISTNVINLTGTPSMSDIGTANIAFSVTNACGSANFSQDINVYDPNRTLTFSVITFPSPDTVYVTLDSPMDIDLNIQSVFADGYIAADCSGGADTSVQLHDRVITAGSVSVSGTELSNGDWTTTNSFRMYNVIVNNVARFNGDVVTIGNFTVTIIFSGC